MAGKKQHFVPRLYLRRYTQGKEKIWVFDKIQMKKFDAHINDVAAERFFYRFTEKEVNLIKERFSGTISESSLDDIITNKVEPIFKGDLSAVLESYHNYKNNKVDYVIENENIESFAHSIAFQYYRTKAYREAMQRNKINEFKYLNYQDEDTLKTGIEVGVLEHAVQMFKRTIKLKEDLVKNFYWIIIENETELPLFTSDNPVVLRIHEGGQVVQAIYDIPDFQINEYAFPLTSKLLLLVVKKDDFIGEILYHKKTKKETYQKVIEAYNEAQLHSCYRQLFCTSDDYKSINGLTTILPNTTSIKVEIE